MRIRHFMMNSRFSGLILPATKLAFTVQPSNVAPNGIMSPYVQVTVQDVAGNTVPSNANISISLNGVGTLSGTTTQSAIAGIATFNDLAIDATHDGDTFTATSFGLTSATSNAFNVTGIPVPHYNAGVHTSIWFDDFTGYAADSTPSSAYAGLGTPGTNHLKRGTVTIDGGIIYNGHQTCRISYDNSGCQPTDSDVGLEKNISGLGGFDSSKLTMYFEYWGRWDSGFYDTSCGGEFKELLWFRFASGGSADARNSFIATKNGGPLVCPDYYGSNVVPAGTIGWTQVNGAYTLSTEPTACAQSANKKEYFRQELQRTTLRPIDIDDGANWHNVLIKQRAESSLDAADGGFWLWIDDTLVMKYDGLDSTDPSYLNNYTRPLPFCAFQLACIVNGGTTLPVSRWVGELRAFRDT